MARACTVCTHPESFAINEALVITRAPYRDIARQFGLSKDAVMRHREHIPKLLARAAEGMAVAEAGTLLERIEALHSRTLTILEELEDTQNYSARLGAIREARANLEVIGEVTKELNRNPTLNLHLSTEWIELRTAILVALEPHPDARESFLRALESVSNGRA
jgi:hypothetical protein